MKCAAELTASSKVECFSRIDSEDCDCDIREERANVALLVISISVEQSVSSFCRDLSSSLTLSSYNRHNGGPKLPSKSSKKSKYNNIPLS